MKPKVVFLKGSKKKFDTGLPWWYSIKNSPCKARDTGSIPGVRSHMQKSNEARAPRRKRVSPRAHAVQEKPPQGEAWVLQ